MALPDDITDKIIKEIPELVLCITNNEQITNNNRTGLKQKCKPEDKEVFLKCICAILNSGGGILRAKNYSQTTIRKELEDTFNELLVSTRIEDFLQIKEQDNDLIFFVKSWNLAEGKTRLFSLNSGLAERSGTSVRSIKPSSVMDFLTRRQREHKDGLVQMETPGIDDNYDKASMFYNEEKALYNQKLDFNESVNVEFKSLDLVAQLKAQLKEELNAEVKAQFEEKKEKKVKEYPKEKFEKKLKKNLQEKLPRYLSAFANTRGGFLFIGIDDKSKEIAGCGQGLSSDYLQETTKAICDAIKVAHIQNCKEQTTFSPEIKVFPVTAKDNENHETNESHIIAIKIPPFCCAVFENGPKSWEIKNGKGSQFKHDGWFKRMQFPISDNGGYIMQDLPLQCQPVHNIQKIKKLQNKIFPVKKKCVPQSTCKKEFDKLQNLFKTVLNNHARGILIISKSWAVDINQERNEDVIGDGLLLSPGEYPKFYSIVQSNSPQLWTYAEKTAFHLKQKLVNIGGYTGKICVIPHLVKSETGELIQHSTESDNTPVYPKIFTLNKKTIKTLLCSLVVVVRSFTSPLSNKLGLKNLLTENQFNILHLCSTIKKLFIHGLPGTGKTLLAMEKINRIRNEHRCSKDNILFLCENEGLKAFVGHDLSVCETRSDFMRKDISDFSEIKHIVVDEGQNFHGKDWFKRAQELTQKSEGVLWIFLDYFQKCHTDDDSLPPLPKEKTVYLDKILRNSTKVFDVMKKQMNKIASRQHLDDKIMIKEINHKCASSGKCYVKTLQEPSDLTKLMEKLQETGYSARDIAVLFSTDTDPILSSLRSVELPFDHGNVKDIDSDVVVLDTVRNFSGLERNVVIVVNLTVDPNQSAVKHNLLLTAYSRARDRLYIFEKPAETVTCLNLFKF